MYRHLFRNRWIALGFVALSAASAASLVGTEEGGGMIDEATAQLNGQKAEFEQQAADLAKPTRSHTVIELDDSGFAEDDDLVDQGTGLEPEPDPGEGFDPAPMLDPVPAEPSPIE
ncbi:hypothetical protein U4960_03265 [Altererythrobacter sp. H2]|uniref:hypothetical protein n=1 Tax=Altererythrobacter sp. H2 TaxID=3108391 RepID=UPI000BD31EBD|nr:hypothetical protein [Altererythrobacter sp. H2]OZA93877.1 MAG: hypothetical protein B7X57_03475 [Erythrobacter sp. 34-65-8]WRK96366.1 hypothetical protein U4960_03265 [Altererythrobacter sp. H2]